MRIQFNKPFSPAKLYAAAFLLCLIFFSAKPSRAADDSSVLNAVCQVVYPVDQFPVTRGYRYIFLGNGFFVNEDGYVVTAAHLLGWFHDGAVPSVLIGPPEGPRQIFDATVVASDTEHDVAILRVTPNPFQTVKNISYLPISVDTPSRGKNVITASLRPTSIDDAHSADVPLVDFSRGEVLDYQFFREEGKTGSELLLFNQQIVPGQSGSPLVSADSHAVVGVVVGRWLHPTVIPSGANGSRLNLAPGAALRAHYAISLLDQLHITWHMASLSAAQVPAASAPASGFTPAIPLTVVNPPYPPRALFGGEVVLDAFIDADGKLTDMSVVSGDSPFLEVVMDAVQNWTFQPARLDGHPAAARIGIVFNFPQSSLPKVTSGERKYEEPSAVSSTHGPLPLYTIEAAYPPNSIGEGSVALYSSVDAQGKIASTSVLEDVPSLTKPAIAALEQWKFAPGKQAGVDADSAVIVVVTSRRPTL